jgi:hypothetical protein
VDQKQATKQRRMVGMFEMPAWQSVLMGEPKRIKHLAERFKSGSFGFVPLVTQDLNVLCGLDILFLRPERTGEIIKSGDIDNRIKTIFDSLRIPRIGEVGESDLAQDENPMYCLLEDDSLVSKLTVEADQWLGGNGADGKNDAMVVLTVTVRPLWHTEWNNALV